MKKCTVIACIIAVLSLTPGCKGRAPAGDVAGQREKPVAKAEQQIKTPVLKKGEALVPPAGRPAAPMPPPGVPSATAPERPLKPPVPPKEIIPGTPLETPPLPPEARKAEREMPLPPVPPAPAVEKPSAVPPEPLKPAAPAGPLASMPGLPTAVPPEPPAPPLAEAEEVAFQPTLIAGATTIDVVMDASGSMNAPFGMRGDTKFDIVRRAVEDVLLSASEQRELPRNIGVRVFGASKPVAENDCTDTEAVVPIGPLDLSRLTAALMAITPQGTSPIARALADAAKDFPADVSGDRVIVLIADGKDTCKGDPCGTARRLRERGFIAQVIGFDIAVDDRDQLACVASGTDGIFHLARNEVELRGAIDQAINANVPYNLRLTVVAGAAPLPTEITILESGTSKIVSKEKSFGTKIFKLKPASYDILVEYIESREKRRPSKLLKGVEILETTKVEQTISFDLGQLTLEAIDDAQKLVPARYRIMKAGSTAPVAEIDAGAEKTTLMLNAGAYDITGQQIGPAAERLTLTHQGIAVRPGEAVDQTFRFQRGSLVLRGETTQKQALPFIYQLFPAGRAETLVASGAVSAEGGALSLSPGLYDMIATGQDPSLPADPRTKVTNIAIKAGEAAELTILFEMGEIELKALDDKGQQLPAEFVIRDAETAVEIARTSSDGKAPAKIPMPPGRYIITAYSTRSTVEPKPSVQIKDVEITAKEPVSKTATFLLGTLRVRGTDAKEAPVRTQFTLYGSGTEDVVATSKPTDQWVIFDVAPGRYDIKATDTTATSAEKPYIMIKDLAVQAGQAISHEAIFTAGQIKIIGRGPNNKIIPVSFKIFEYGADRELINGKTGDDWVKYEIPPGRYYLEAAYVDPIQSVLLKKWVNVTVGENEVVEQVLRF